MPSLLLSSAVPVEMLAVVAGAASVSAHNKLRISSTQQEVGTCRAFSLRTFLLA